MNSYSICACKHDRSMCAHEHCALPYLDTTMLRLAMPSPKRATPCITSAWGHHDAPRGPWYLKVWVSSTARRPNSCTARALRLRLPLGECLPCALLL